MTVDGFQYDAMIELIRGKAAEYEQQAMDIVHVEWNTADMYYNDANTLREAADILSRDAG